MLSRRHLFGASAAAVAVSVMPAAAMASTAASDAQILHWESEVVRLVALASDKMMDDERTDELCDEAAEYEAKIAEAPCNSQTAALVKMRTVVREAAVSGAMYRIDTAALVDGIITFLEARN